MRRSGWRARGGGGPIRWAGRSDSGHGLNVCGVQVSPGGRGGGGGARGGWGPKRLTSTAPFAAPSTTHGHVLTPEVLARPSLGAISGAELAQSACSGVRGQKKRGCPVGSMRRAPAARGAPRPPRAAAPRRSGSRAPRPRRSRPRPGRASRRPRASGRSAPRPSSPARPARTQGGGGLGTGRMTLS